VLREANSLKVDFPPRLAFQLDAAWAALVILVPMLVLIVWLATKAPRQ
jgi:hypothetical protein